MDNQLNSPTRPWRQIAEQASKEANADRLMELAAELTEALDKECLAKKLKNKATQSR